jgi:hypothetical protein
MAKLELKQVAKSFGDTAVIHGLDLTGGHGDSTIGLGAMVGLQFDPEQAHLFMANGQRAC